MFQLFVLHWKLSPVPPADYGQIPVALIQTTVTMGLCIWKNWNGLIVSVSHPVLPLTPIKQKVEVNHLYANIFFFFIKLSKKKLIFYLFQLLVISPWLTEADKNFQIRVTSHLHAGESLVKKSKEKGRKEKHHSLKWMTRKVRKGTKRSLCCQRGKWERQE